jgi:hypothetical protein
MLVLVGLRLARPVLPESRLIPSHFTFRVDTWTPDSALATFRAACERWPGTPITLRQGARVIEDSRRLRLARLDKGRQSAC